MIIKELVDAISSSYYANYDDNVPQKDKLEKIIKISNKILKECNDD